MSFLFGIGPEEWNNLKAVREKYNINLRLATSWINSHEDLLGWWTESFFPKVLWDMGCVPHIITWGYITGSGWGTDYSAANLKKYRQAWLDDLAYMANRLKGEQQALVSLETEFNGYLNIDMEYWNQLMIDSHNVIKSVAPNVLVSYCHGGWGWRWGDISWGGLLTESMRQMDFMSFQNMWGCGGDAQTWWMQGDDLKTKWEGINWVEMFGDKPHIWDYQINDIIENLKALRKFNPKLFLAHLAIDHHLWGPQCQVDVVNAIKSNFETLKSLGLFGISWMDWWDHHWDEWAYWSGDILGQCSGCIFPDGSAKPVLSPFIDLVNTTTEELKKYVFSHWEDGSTNPTRTITMKTDVNIIAYYIEAKPMRKLLFESTPIAVTAKVNGYDVPSGSFIEVEEGITITIKVPETVVV